MKKQTTRLLFFVLFSVLLGSSVIASRPQTCRESCSQRQSATLQRCERLSGDAKTNCQNTANEQYNKCAQACDNSGKDGGGGKNP